MFFSLLLCGIRIAKTLIQELSKKKICFILYGCHGGGLPPILALAWCRREFHKAHPFEGHYCYKRSLVARGPISPPILSLGAFELQASVFKCTMKANLAATMESPLWWTLLQNCGALYQCLTFWSTPSLNISSWQRLLLCKSWGVLKMKELFQIFSWNQSWGIGFLITCILFWEFSQNILYLQNFLYGATYDMWRKAHKLVLK
jgi:hypothetical protein